MNNNTWAAIGKVFFALAVLCIGIVHFVVHNFPIGLMPVPEFPQRIIIVYVSGTGLIISGLLILSNRFANIGAWIAFVIWLITLLVVQLPLLIASPQSGGAWAAFSETAMLVAGSMLLLDAPHSLKQRSVLTVIACYLFAATLHVFEVQHFIYAQYIATLITPWIPFKLFFSYFVGVAFLSVAVSIIMHKFVKPATIALGIMFLLWFFVLHLPRVLAHQHTEAEWTSLFFVLASSGEAFLIAGSAEKTNPDTKPKK